MSWVALVPRDKVHGRARHPVTLSVSKSGRIVQRAFVTVQTDLLPELPWWSNKAMVSVELGTGDADHVRADAGRL